MKLTPKIITFDVFSALLDIQTSLTGLVEPLIAEYVRSAGGTVVEAASGPAALELLGSDEDHSVAEAYGVWKEKSMYGRKFMGIERSTFLIGPDGVLKKIWRKVKVDGHAEAVLAEVGGEG